MSSNLDRSLDEILAARPRGGARRGGKRTSTGGVAKRPQRAAAQKATAQVTPNAAKAATKAANNINASKIIVSNLPHDVNEAMIKVRCL
jgi:THO complex subunit 4